MNRCSWPGNDPIYIAYHDTEWGVPVYDDIALFESLILDGFQAGLSWITILKKRENFRNAFDQFNPEKIARYNEEKIEELMHDEGINRNRKKILAAISNAQAFLRLKQQEKSFSHFLWSFVNHQPIQNAWQKDTDIPTQTPASEAMSKALKKAGFKFCGPTICYAFMQAVGMVNDHLTTCFRYASCSSD